MSAGTRYFSEGRNDILQVVVSDILSNGKQWWQHYQCCEVLNGQDSTVKVTRSIMSPQAGQKLDEYHYSGGTTFSLATGGSMANSRTC